MYENYMPLQLAEYYSAELNYWMPASFLPIWRQNFSFLWSVPSTSLSLATLSPLNINLKYIFSSYFYLDYNLAIVF